MKIEQRLEELGVELPRASGACGELRHNRADRQYHIYFGTWTRIRRRPNL